MILKEIILARQVLTRLSATKLDFQLAYLMAKFMSETEGDAQFYVDKTNEIIKEFNGEQSSQDQGFVFPEENTPKVIEAMTLLDNTKVKEPTTKLPLDKMSSIKDFTMEQAIAILPFVLESGGENNG